MGIIFNKKNKGDTLMRYTKTKITLASLCILGYAQSAAAIPADASNWTELNSALANAAVTEVNLLDSITAGGNIPTQARLGATLVVNGGGHTIYGNGYSGFWTNMNELTLNNITVRDFGTAAIGGVIRGYGTAIVINIGSGSSFINNSTATGAGNGAGGVIYNAADTGINIGNNVLFSGNRAQGSYGSGGALYGANIVIGENATFENNQALGTISGSGGAISGSTNLTIGSGATFTGNHAVTTGGAITFGTGTMTINTDGGTTLFQGNTDNTGANDIALSAYTFSGTTYSTTLNITGNSGEVIFNSGLSSSEVEYDAMFNPTPLPLHTGIQLIKAGTNDLIFGENANNANFLGIFTQTAGTTTFYGQVLAGVNNIENSNLNLWQTTPTVDISNLNLTNANVNTINDQITTFSIANFSATGMNDFSIDIDGLNGTSDQFDIVSGTGNGTINIADFNVTNAPTATTINITPFTGDISGYTFTSSETEVITPIYVYHVTSEGDGIYQLWRSPDDSALNKDVFRGAVSTLSAYSNQVSTANLLLDRLYLENAHPMRCPKVGRFWVKGYGNFGKIKMTQGLSVDNDSYGLLAGLDGDIHRLGNGWKFFPTFYAGYNGARQSYHDVSINQQGGQGGAMGTIQKGDFSTTLLGFAGGYNNRMKVSGNNDETSVFFTGTAARSTYDLHPANNIIIQPALMAMYGRFNSQKWHSDYGNIDMRAGSLNGGTVSPGINWIYRQTDWQAYALTRYVQDLGGTVSGVAGPVDLPNLKINGNYWEYGLGASANYSETLTYYGQATLQSGKRQGTALQAGLAWAF